MATAETAPRRERPVRDDVAALAREELTALTDALAAAPPVPSAPGRSALAARVAAESLVDAPDVADVVGALVLARTGRRDLARTAGRLRKP